MRSGVQARDFGREALYRPATQPFHSELWRSKLRRPFQGAPTEPDAGFSTQNLDLMTVTGQREHWLIKPEHIQRQVERRVGSGSFGVVLQGTFVGTPLAVKLAKKPRPTILLRSLLTS